MKKNEPTIHIDIESADKPKLKDWLKTWSSSTEQSKRFVGMDFAKAEHTAMWRTMHKPHDWLYGAFMEEAPVYNKHAEELLHRLQTTGYRIPQGLKELLKETTLAGYNFEHREYQDLLQVDVVHAHPDCTISQNESYTFQLKSSKANTSTTTGRWSTTKTPPGELRGRNMDYLILDEITDCAPIEVLAMRAAIEEIKSYMEQYGLEVRSRHDWEEALLAMAGERKHIKKWYTRASKTYPNCQTIYIEWRSGTINRMYITLQPASHSTKRKQSTKQEQTMNISPRKLLSAIQSGYVTANVVYQEFNAATDTYEFGTRQYTYKVPPALTLTKDDLVVVPRHGDKSEFVVAKIVEVHTTAQIHDYQRVEYRWIIQKVDLTGYNQQLEQEQKMIDQIIEAERINKRTEVVDGLKKKFPEGSEARKLLEQTLNEAAVVGNTPAITDNTKAAE